MIARINNYLKGKKAVIHGFYESAEYMSPGSYTFNESIKYITRVDEEPKAAGIIQSFYRNSLLKYMVRFAKGVLFRKRLELPHKDLAMNQFLGTVYVPLGAVMDIAIKGFLTLVIRKCLRFYRIKRIISQ
ncbi:hypothetical protein WQ57_18415 [Mesobacillus campisalis]|uniref:Uncharacterized protein n=1 Tax=Mesobacillus campisalis TaxID=1408103 RepID=A0A0M2SUF5_9BACI|nr:hypothetical protein [Mesobacillus campisalis]KKK36622.1 hypothetical protein WQ57_18415 [Mesobacillus campisalis]